MPEKVGIGCAALYSLLKVQPSARTCQATNYAEGRKATVGGREGGVGGDAEIADCSIAESAEFKGFVDTGIPPGLAQVDNRNIFIVEQISIGQKSRCCNTEHVGYLQIIVSRRDQIAYQIGTGIAGADDMLLNGNIELG